MELATSLTTAHSCGVIGGKRCWERVLLRKASTGSNGAKKRVVADHVRLDALQGHPDGGRYLLLFLNIVFPQHCLCRSHKHQQHFGIPACQTNARRIASGSLFRKS